MGLDKRASNLQFEPLAIAVSPLQLASVCENGPLLENRYPSELFRHHLTAIALHMPHAHIALGSVAVWPVSDQAKPKER